jgi:hypothetical protein
MTKNKAKNTLGMRMTLQAKIGKCRICGCNHEPNMPHNINSTYYRMSFFKKNGRMPTIRDAISHCPPSIRKRALDALECSGIKA